MELFFLLNCVPYIYAKEAVSVEPAVWMKGFEKDHFCLPFAVLYTCLGFLIQMLTLQVEDAVLVLQKGGASCRC